MLKSPTKDESVGSSRIPRIAVMVLNRNGVKWLGGCLSSLVETAYPQLDIYLVDNASVDGSVRYVQKFFPQVKIVRHLNNLGFAEGYNRALESVEADYLILLNNDTRVLSPTWVKHLVELSSKDPDIAAVSCKMVSMGDHSCLDSVGVMGIPFWRGFIGIGMEECDRGQYDRDGLEPFSFSGGAALIKRAAFAEVGGFDDRFFMYNEDVDLSWRLRLLGYRVVYAPEATVAHYAGGSTEGKIVTHTRFYWSHRNLLRAILKNCGSSLGWALRNYFLFSTILAIGFSSLEPRKALAVVKAIWWNLLNFGDSWAERIAIQSSRRTSETEILSRMYPKFKRYESLRHPIASYVLNILFEYSQSIPSHLDRASVL